MTGYRSLIAAIAMAPMLASCVGQQMPPHIAAQSEARLAQQLAGKVPGAAVNCLPRSRSNDMDVIDHDTILFRSGSTVYVQNTRGSCYPQRGNSDGYTLVTRGIGSSGGLCDGDIAQVVDSATGMFAGACSFNPFVPYRSVSR